jgi:hypothetical protein
MTVSDKPFDGLTDSEVFRLQRLYTALIGHINPRIFYAETRRGSFATAGVAILASGVALLLGALSNQDSIHFRPAFWALLALAVGSMVTGVMVLLIYSGQTNFDYPFKKATSTWKWFYRDAIPGTTRIPVPWHTIQLSQSRAAAEKVFSDEWEPFVNRYLDLTDIRVNALQDLQQVYVLHVNEFYKNKFLTQIRRVMTAGLIATAIATIGVFAGVWLCGG